MHFKVIVILRDAAIITALTFISGFVLGFSGAMSLPNGMLALALSNILFGTVGFVICGCLSEGNRWKHLIKVGFVVYLLGLINVIFFGYQITQWFWSFIVIFFMLGMGGAISYIFKGNQTP